MMICFGSASGAVPPLDIAILGKKGSLKITRPTIFTHISDHVTCLEMAKHLGEKVLSGDVKIVIGQRFALKDVAKAHEALEARKTTGSTILEI
jgi:NADPH2:quinone reductase